MGRYDIDSLVSDIEKVENAKEAPEKKEEKRSEYLKLTLPDNVKRMEYVLRLLENPDSETSQPWVQRDAHMFPYPNRKFCYQPCPKRRDILAGIKPAAKCPICEDKDRLYDTGDPAKEQMGQKRTPKKRYFYNVLVVKDPRENGKNEGKVFIFEMGDQLQKKCAAFLTNKEIPASDRCFFHPLKGTNLKVVMTKKSEQLNYDDSEFSRSTSPLVVNNKEITTMEEAEAFITQNCFKLREKLLAPTVYRSYEEIKEYYDNQGEVEKKKDSPKPSDPFADKTIDNQKVTARNPVQKVPEIKTVTEEELPFSVTQDDDDAKLEALLNG